MSSVKISIITINYNDAAGLRKTIESVISQSNQQFEYIIIDGGSTDDSLKVIYTYASRFYYWVSERDYGIYDAMNKGVARATGAYLIFLNSGDCFRDQEVLENSFKFLNANQAIDIFYANKIVVNDPKHPAAWEKRYPAKISLKFLKEDTLNHQASIIRASLFVQFGLYPVHYKLAADYWLYLISLLNNKQFCHMDFPMVNYDLGGVSGINHKKYKIEKREIWDSLVPESINDLLHQSELQQQMLDYKIIKAAVALNSFFQKFRGYF